MYFLDFLLGVVVLFLYVKLLVLIYKEPPPLLPMLPLLLGDAGGEAKSGSGPVPSDDSRVPTNKCPDEERPDEERCDDKSPDEERPDEEYTELASSSNLLEST